METPLKNVTCHYCRVSRVRAKESTEYIDCNNCQMSFCARCLGSHMEIDFETINKCDWICPCCCNKCCCKFETCPKKQSEHRHCFTYRRTLKRHAQRKPKWIKQKRAAQGIEFVHMFQRGKTDFAMTISDFESNLKRYELPFIRFADQRDQIFTFVNSRVTEYGFQEIEIPDDTEHQVNIDTETKTSYNDEMDEDTNENCSRGLELQVPPASQMDDENNSSDMVLSSPRGSESPSMLPPSTPDHYFVNVPSSPSSDEQYNHSPTRKQVEEVTLPSFNEVVEGIFSQMSGKYDNEELNVALSLCEIANFAQVDTELSIPTTTQTPYSNISSTSNTNVCVPEPRRPKRLYTSFS
eukprot:TRINITY_DN11427_c0_g1_i1.p1 TRINITY_DN11427_c0_g1~~TRINITY_DN11427_c0_g1_i1.p1  ORF type:complete len:352 (-),score=29.40 TRINITY_DN11427_c0_g1_i1:90-1145(-)